jgi:SAM-dependent methyltransferase
MNTARASLGPGHFQRLYDAGSDPWRFRSSEYEQAKYRTTVASLGTRRFRFGFEAGCSIGVLTRLLAEHCDALLAVDIVEAPLAAARATCSDQPQVRFQQMQIPRQWPNETFDLIVLSEVLYFLSPTDITATADRVVATLDQAGIVLLVNWCGRADDPCTGDEAARIFMDRTSQSLSVQAHHRTTDYRLDILRRHCGQP